MKNCSNCGASFSGHEFKCPSCRTQETIKKENEKNRQQNENLNRQNAEAAKREAYLQREMMERHASEQRMFAAHQQELAEQQLYLENQKLNELQKQTRLIEEQAITAEEAFQDGLNIVNLRTYLWTNCANNFEFDNPYITTKLNNAYIEGVRKKITILFPDESVWLKELILKIEFIATQKRQLFLNLEDKINENGFSEIYESIELIFNDVKIDFGYLFIDLLVEVIQHTGEIKFKNKERTNIINYPKISRIFDSAFNESNLLELVNENHKKLSRLEILLSKQVEEYTKLVEFQKNSNQDTIFQNLKTILVYLIFIYGFYVLFTAGFFIFNIFPAGGVWLIATIVAWGNYEIHSLYDLEERIQTLNKLKEFLSDTRAKLNNQDIQSNFDNSISHNDTQNTTTVEFNSKKNTRIKTLIISLVVILVIIISFLQFPVQLEFFNSKSENHDLIEMPLELQSFIEKKNQCDIFLSSAYGDAEQKKLRMQNIKKFCPETDLQLANLRKKYSNDKLVIDKLSQFAFVNILETGPNIGHWYEGLRNQLIANKWKPWNFDPINNFDSPFPEVLICDEGICNSFFEKNSGKNIFHVTYKICNSPYDDVGCPGYENGFLMIENYETITIKEAINYNKLAKDHFE